MPDPTLMDTARRIARDVTRDTLRRLLNTERATAAAATDAAEALADIIERLDELGWPHQQTKRALYASLAMESGETSSFAHVHASRAAARRALLADLTPDTETTP